MSAKLKILQESIERVKAIDFGEPITNVCAGESNPHRHSFFVKFKIKRRTNGFGVVHKQHLVRCTDKKGKFWDTYIDVIYPGHLPYDECLKLFEPVWQAEYGKQ
jgi:hypothetical protein